MTMPQSNFLHFTGSIPSGGRLKCDTPPEIEPIESLVLKTTPNRSFDLQILKDTTIREEFY